MKRSVWRSLKSAVAAVQEREHDRWRAEGARAAGELLGALAETVEGTEFADLRRGLVAGSAFCSMTAASLESGETEFGFVEIDGESFPVDLRVRGAGPDGDGEGS